MASAATCSCAGVPLLASIDTSASQEGDFFINYSTEYHQISDLVRGSEDIPDETGRDRNSFSQVLSASYAFSDRWSVSALVSHVEHNRTIGTGFFGKETTSGMGDSVVLVRYLPLYRTPFSRHELSLGLGARIATGDDSFGSGFVVSEDMQPSTGASASILWSSYSYAFNQAATLQLNASASYTDNAENDRQYTFGNETSITLGLAQTVGTRFSWSAGLRLRETDADQRFGFDIPNTGGQWLDFVPAVQFSVGDALKLGLFGRVPLDRDLEGALQFTTSYSYGLSLTYGF